MSGILTEPKKATTGKEADTVRRFLRKVITASPLLFPTQLIFLKLVNKKMQESEK